MTKADIVTEISRKTGLEKAAVLTVVEEFMTTVKESMGAGNNVYLRGFGSFVVKTRKEKTARNISKNTAIKIPEHKVPTFKPSKVFLRPARALRIRQSCEIKDKRDPAPRDGASFCSFLFKRVPYCAF